MTLRISLLASLVGILFSAFSMAQSLSFEWAHAFGDTGWSEGRAVTADKSGNVYTIGHFKGTVDFDPGVGVFSLTAIDDGDGFILKLDAAGNFLWAKQFGDSAFVECNAIALDTFGNVYTAGSFLGQLDFDPGTGVFDLVSSWGGRDVFIQKLDSNGNFIWTKQFSGITPTLAGLPSPTNAFDIAVDDDGNVYTTGYFDGEVDFDPDTATTATLSVFQMTDVFISKLDSDGNFVWVKQLGSLQQGVVGYSIDLDDSGNIYSTGVMGGSVDFDPGPNTFILSTSVAFQSESYVSKLDASGNFLWAKQLGAGSGMGLAVDADANVYMSAETPSYTTTINKLSSSGNLLWTKQTGGVYGKSLTLDRIGNVYTCGPCYGTNDFDPGPGVFNLTAGNSDGFISKLDSSGGFVWAGLISSTDQVWPTSIATDESDNVYTTGYFSGTADFDPSVAAFNLSAPVVNTYHIFVQKLASARNVGIAEIGFEADVRIYPNPTAGNLMVEFDNVYENLELVLRTITGQIVGIKQVNNAKNCDFQIDEPAGVYVLEVTNDQNRKVVFRVVKE